MAGRRTRRGERGSFAAARRSLSASLALLAAGLAAAGCSPAPRVVPSPHDRAAAALAPHGYHAWWSRIAEVMEQELGFPPLDTVLVLLPHQHALEQELVRDGMPPDLARQAASRLDAVGRAGKVLANQTSFRALPWPQRVVALAHELTHSAQYSLSGGRRGGSEQWLREGFAEWVAWRVAEALRTASAARHRREARARVAEARRAGALPPLAELRSGPDLLAQLARHRRAPIYDQAFLAADLLVAEHGIARVVEYFRFFAENDDRELNFQRAFGETHAAFCARFARALDDL